MTHQISDSLTYGANTKYSLLGLSENKIATYILQHYGFQKTGIMSSCWRGCHGKYTIENHYLYLNSLDVVCPKSPYPRIGDVIPNDEFHGLVSYQELHEKLRYTGQLAIGTPFIANAYMPYPHDFETVYSLEFADGYLKTVNNLSEPMAIIREKYAAIQQQMQNDTTQRQPGKYNKALDKLRSEACNLVRIDDEQQS